MNVLILSSGRRNKIIEYFKRTLNGKGEVIAADCSVHAPSIYVADKYEIVPRIDDPKYFETIIKLCKKHEIDAVLSLIDPELLILSKNRKKFEEIGVSVIGSDYSMVSLANNKYLFQQKLKESGFPSIPSYLDINKFKEDYNNEKISFPVFVKPYDGSASVGIRLVHDMETLDGLFQNNKQLMIQKYMDGKEIGIDVYVDCISGEVCSIYGKEKLLMRSGETDKSSAYYSSQLEKLIISFIKQFPYRGIIDMDVFLYEGKYYISEVNPRFGGGYLHGEEAGFSVIPYIINNVQGQENKDYQINKNDSSYMYKYSEVTLVRREME